MPESSPQSDNQAVLDRRAFLIGKALKILTSPPCIIIALGFIVFSNCLNNGFVWDDINYIISNQALHHPLSFSYVFSKANFFNSQGMYRPLMTIYFNFLYYLYADAPYHYHLIQLWIHIINAYLVYLLFKRFFNKTLSFILSLIFLVHPLQVESVSYISGTIEPVFFLFGISALHVSLSDKLSLLRLALISCLLLLALFTSETSVLFLFLIVLYRIVFHKKQKITLFATTGLIFIIYVFMHFYIADIYPVPIYNGYPYIWTQPLGIRMLNIPAIWFYYLKNFLDPSNIGIYQIWVVKQIDFTRFYLPLIFDFVFLGILLFFGRRVATTRKNNLHVFTFFFVWLIVGLLFYSQLFPLDSTVADRWMYFPIAGLLGTIGVSIQNLNSKSVNAKIAGVILAIIVISLLSFRTINRNNDWKTDFGLNLHDFHNNNDITSQEVLFNHTISPTPAIWQAPIQ
ncbi:MAG TPA: hypothetical protein VND99_01915 [Candidatus Acidoferrales bacterium]|nr:hypothetical protein [Candidatus Acidoferrales bacterium]